VEVAEMDSSGDREVNLSQPIISREPKFEKRKHMRQKYGILTAMKNLKFHTGSTLVLGFLLLPA
jgi:hypothetical protein